ncbi:hypothetical protein JG687_00004664 [Phytophthora cactorum]|uniref:Uncharacterized protein n=1 Tax=Phytophthora cactorum TaxID=29920 RepID=A0A8T1UND0_9STRA|nr:hypothetical protein JG687_00004664 [Phytophthora cactorum]
MKALSWMDSKTVHFLSTGASTQMQTVGNYKVIHQHHLRFRRLTQPTTDVHTFRSSVPTFRPRRKGAKSQHRAPGKKRKRKQTDKDSESGNNSGDGE